MSALIAAVAGWGAKLAVGVSHPLLTAAAVLGTYGALYLGLTMVLGIPEARSALTKMLRRRS